MKKLLILLTAFGMGGTAMAEPLQSAPVQAISAKADSSGVTKQHRRWHRGRHVVRTRTVCRTQWRHGHRVRVCRQVRIRR